MLRERVRLKDDIGAIYFITRHDISKWFGYAGKQQCLVKNFLANQSCQKFRPELD